jgi:hypothetical protein
MDMNSNFSRSIGILNRLNKEGFDGFRPSEGKMMLRPQQEDAIKTKNTYLYPRRQEQENQS